MINLLFFMVHPTGASKVDQTHKLDDFLDLIQFCQISPDSVLIGMKIVKNDIFLLRKGEKINK